MSLIDHRGACIKLNPSPDMKYVNITMGVHDEARTVLLFQCGPEQASDLIDQIRIVLDAIVPPAGIEPAT